MPDVLKTLARLKDLEQSMADYYVACSESWPEMSTLWMELAVEEEKHVVIVERLMEIVSSSPGQLAMRTEVELSAIDTYIMNIEDVTRDIRQKACGLKEALNYAKGFESAIFESNFLDLFEAGSRMFRELTVKVHEDLDQHRSQLEEAINSLS
jgi:hypothetical protein